jgi:hypothetical protein
MFVVDELGELLGIGSLDGVEGGGLAAQGFGQAVQEPLGDIRVEGALQQFAGEIKTAAGYVIARRRDVVASSAEMAVMVATSRLTF